MLCSLNWLRALCPVEADAETVARTLTARGLTVDALERRGDEIVLDIDVPANRPDCLGHLGLARELAAAFDIPLSPSAPSETGFERAPDPAPQIAAPIQISFQGRAGPCPPARAGRHYDG